MNICTAMEKFNQCKDVLPLRRTRVVGDSTIYTCFVCKYESNRQYNVVRHEKRIHATGKLRICCGSTFFTKGDYYIHCEQKHPQTRSHTTTSRNKYKITRDTVASMDYQSSNRQLHCRKRVRSTFNMQLRQRFSKRIRIQEQKEVKSEVSVKYSITYSDFDMENIPLISFLTDHRLKSYLRRLSSSKLINKTGDKSTKEAKQTVKIAISSEQNIEKAVPENGVENVRAKLSDSAVSSFSVELPAKKLILHRFRTSVKHEFKIPLREQNNNVRGQVNFAGQAKETAPALQNWLKNSKRSTWANKENVSKFAFSLEEQLNIKLDRGMKVPMVTQLHRDFLASIDFDKYKIF